MLNSNYKYLVLILSTNLGQSKSTWKEEIKEDWRFSACTEDTNAIDDLFSRAKKLNKILIIFYHGSIDLEFLNEKIRVNLIDKNILFIDSFHHITGDFKYEAIKSKNIKQLKNVILSSLKNKIISNWLPLYIDIQGLNEIKNNQGKRNKYLEEILKNYNYKIIKEMHQIHSKGVKLIENINLDINIKIDSFLVNFDDTIQNEDIYNLNDLLVNWIIQIDKNITNLLENLK